jgi:formate/nitrite transporter
MDSLKPAEVVGNLINAGALRAPLSAKDILIRGFVAGALLGIATSLAITAAVQSGVAIVGAVIFPVGFVMIVVLGMELVTGNFAIVPMALFAGRFTFGGMLRNFALAFLGNLLGALAYAFLFAIAISNDWTTPATAGVAQRVVQLAEARTVAYEALGQAGMVTVFVKAILCNWMVCMGVTMSLASTSQIGRLFGAWLPILIFFGQGFEHAVVNMFVVPAGMLLGAHIDYGQWWLWNQIPVTIGNFVGGFVMVGCAFYFTFTPAGARSGGMATDAATAAGDD